MSLNKDLYLFICSYRKAVFYRMRKLSLILSIFLVGIVCQAQNQIKLDSLSKLLKAAKEDTGKVLLYIDLGNEYELTDLQTAGKYYLLAGDLSKRLHYKRGIIKFISNY